MMLYDKVILVGEDNLCETIMAEAILKKLTENINLEIMSRGLVVLFPEPVNPKAVVVLKENQMELPKKYSEELLAEDITDHTLIITMKEAQAQKIRNKFQTNCTIRTLRELSDLSGDISTPIGEIENYQTTFEHIDLVMKVAAQRLLELARSEEEPDKARMQDAVEQLVEQIFEETVQTTIGDKIELTEEEKKHREEELTAEYMEIVEKTQAREAAREAAKTSDVTEIKQLINERKAIIQQEEEAMWGTPGDDDDNDDIVEYVD